MARIRRILYPTDFSGAARAALGQAIDLAKTNRAELTVAHVLAPPVLYVGEGYAYPQVYDRLIAASRAEAQKRLAPIVARAKAAGIRAKGLLMDGIPADRIVRAAKAKGVDLIVLGTHGRTGLARFFLGSVASRVVATAGCPVLTVRGKSRPGRSR